MTTTSPSDHGLPARAVERFWKRVTKTDACWTHGGSVASHGYPQATLSGRSQPAHRAWCEARALKELFAGMQGGEEGGVIEDVEELATFGDEGGFEA